jgi:hypothetical protein
MPYRVAEFETPSEESKRHFLALMRLCHLKHNVMNDRVGYWRVKRGFRIYDNSDDLWLVELLKTHGFVDIAL